MGAFVFALAWSLRGSVTGDFGGAQRIDVLRVTVGHRHRNRVHGDQLSTRLLFSTATLRANRKSNLIEQATRKLRVEQGVHEVDVELSFDAETLLAEGYVAEVGVRLSLYERLSSASDDAEIPSCSAKWRTDSVGRGQAAGGADSPQGSSASSAVSAA